MANKEATLKRRLIKHSAIVAGITIMVLIAAIFLDNHDDEVQAEKDKQEEQNNTMRSDEAALQQALTEGLEVNKYYEVYSRNHNTNFVLNRDIATQWMTILREKNHLINMEVTISPITDMKGSNLALKTDTAISSNITVSFNAITDNSVYGFIEALEHHLPGMILINDLTITHTGSLTRDVLVALSEHRIIPMVSAKISFIWIGIKPKPAEKPKAQNVTTQHMAAMEGTAFHAQ